MRFDIGKHSFQVAEATAMADRLVIADDKNRVLVYSFDGQLKGTVAGRWPSVSAKADLKLIY